MSKHTPELLEACRLMANAEGAWLEVIQFMNKHGKPAPALISLAIEQAKSAIAKAEGTKQ